MVNNKKENESMNDLVPKNFIDTGLDAVAQAKELTILDQIDYDVASAMGKAYSDQIKKVKEYFKPRKDKAKSVHTDWVTAEKEALKQYEEAKAILKVTVGKYEDEQERLRREKEAKMKKELEEKQAKEAKKAEAKGQEYEPEITPEDIVVHSSFKSSGQARKVKELVVSDLSAFLVWLGQSNYNPEDYVDIKNTPVKGLANNPDIPGISLKIRTSKVF